jgi:transcriptional regulator with XRE-family HTH domain
MKVPVASLWDRHASTGTGGSPLTGLGDDQLWLMVWSLSGTSGLAAIDAQAFASIRLLFSGTTSGWLQEDEPPASQKALFELRQRTDLTWAQLARALGVQRRSLHFWAKGERLSAPNFERLMRVAGIVRSMDKGSPAETTAFLMSPAEEGPSPFDLLCEGQDAAVAAMARSDAPDTSSATRRHRPPQLSREQRARRQSVPVSERLVGLQDQRPLEFGKFLGSIPIADESA